MQNYSLHEIYTLGIVLLDDSVMRLIGNFCWSEEEVTFEKISIVEPFVSSAEFVTDLLPRSILAACVFSSTCTNSRFRRC